MTRPYCSHLVSPTPRTFRKRWRAEGRLRTSLASERHVPAYIIFGDAALRDMARRRPSTLECFLNVRGVGETKCEQYGRVMVEKIRAYCLEHALDLDR